MSQDDCFLESWNQCKYDEFGKFLGFSTLGLEKSILEFFQELRGRRKKILNKEAAENTRFERELKRLQFSVNYEKGNNSRSTVKCAGGKRMVYQ